MSYTVGSTRVINTTSASGTTEFTFTFPYIKEAHIEVYKDYTKLTQATGDVIGANEYKVITNVSPKLVRLGTGIASANLRVEIRRNSSLDTPLVDYADGSTLTANDLDTSALQSLYIDQELKDSQFQTVSISATTGHPTLNNNPLTEVANPTNAQDAATKNYVDTNDALKLAKAGDSMTGVLAMGTHKVTGVGDPTIAQDAATKNYVDTQDNTKLSLSGGTMTDSIAMGANKITGVADPTAAQDAATKNYVDTQQISSSQIGADSIGTNQLQDNSVASANIIDGAIVNADINASAAIAQSKLALDITNTNINASADIAGSKLADGGITAAKLHVDTVITSSEQGSATVNDTSFLTSQASDARYFNVSTGDTIKNGDAFPDNDTTIATTAAINDRIIDLVDDVGGFVPIANETSFPAANPDVNNGTGTLISIKAFAASHTPSSGTVTITDGAGSGNDITITGCGTTVLTAGYGGILETTATLHTYSFHRLVPKATEVTSVATNVSPNIANINTVATNITNINDFSDKYRVASSAPTSNNDAGDLYFNTTSNELQVYNGSEWQGGVTATGNLAGLGANTFTGNQSHGEDIKSQWGADNDLQIYHQTGVPGVTHIKSNTTADFEIGKAGTNSGNVFVKFGSDDSAIFKKDGAVELYYDDVKSFETNDNGATVYGGEGQHASLYIYADEGDDNADKARIQQSSTGDFWIENYASGSWEAYLKATGNAGVELYFDNVKKLETLTGGVNIVGALTVNGAAVGGGGATFEATTDGAVSEGDPLLVESNGKVKKVNQLSDGVSSELDIDTSSSLYAPLRSTYHPNTGWGYVIRRRSSTRYYQPIKSNGTTFTLGTESSLGGYISEQDHMFSPAIGGNDDGKMGLAYLTGDDAKLQVGSINSSTGVFSSDSGTISIDGDADYETVATIYCPNADRWVYFYAEDQSNETSREGKYRVVDGTTVGSKKGLVDQDGSVGPYFRRPKTFFDSTTGRITIMGDSPPTNIIRYRTGIVGSSSVTWHSIGGDDGSVSVADLPQVMSGSHNYYDVIWVQDLNMFLGAKTYNSKMYMYKGTFNADGTISWDFIEYLNNSSSEYATGDVSLGYTAGKLLIVYRGSSDTTKYATVSVSSSGALSSWSINSISSNEPAGIEVIAFNKGRAIGLYRDESDDHIKGICKQFVSSDLEDKFVGIADANYADGATATVLCAGNVSDKHSSLTPGSKYYVSTTGTLSTSKANPEVFAGTAVSATTITVRN